MRVVKQRQAGKQRPARKQRPAGSQRPAGKIRRRALLSAAVVALILIIVVVAGWIQASRDPVARVNRSLTYPPALAGLQQGPPPWPPGTPGLAERLSTLSFPQLPEEPDTYHIHAHVDVFLAGESVPLPAGIGIDQVAGYSAPLHTHADTGIIHVESPVIKDYTLGQFFAVWGIRLSEGCLGDYCEDEGRRLEVFVNGRRFEGDPYQLVLEPYQQIVVAYGNEEQLSRDYPSSYVFPEGT